jgi:hypothetical protein
MAKRNTGSLQEDTDIWKVDVGIFKKHPVLFGIIGFLLFTIPQAIVNYWELVQMVGGIKMHIVWYFWFLPILPVIGLALFVILIYQNRQNKKATERKPINNSISLESLDIANKENSKLKSEIERLNEVSKPLWMIRNQQLQSLKQSNTTLLFSKYESIQFHGLNYLEPFITIQVLFVNCSIFKIKLQDTKINVELNQNTLSANSSLTSGNTQLYLGDKMVLQFQQQITNATVNLLKKAIDEHQQITWKIILQANYAIDENKDEYPLIHQIDHTERL